MNDSPAGSGRHIVELDSVGRVFGSKRSPFVALTDVGFSVEEGEFVAVVGPSGCGKSTLLKIMAGLMRPTSGQVRIEGQVVEGPLESVGLMLQTSTLFPWRTVEKNITLPLDVRGEKNVDREKRVREVLDLVGLEGQQKRYPRQLSGGMQQRVALCRLLISDPHLMLLDEPFGSLDEFTREKLNIELSRIVEKEGKTALLVTHSIGEAVFLADRVVVMGAHPGRVLDVIDVKVPRPRTAEVLSSPGHLETVQRVRRTLGLS